MSLTCPHCGTHLNLTLAEDKTFRTAAAAAAAPQRLVLAKKPVPQLDVTPTAADLRRLKRTMCFPYCDSVRWKPTQPTMRPIFSKKEDEVGVLKDGRARETLDRVATKMHATIRTVGEQSVDTLLESRKRTWVDKHLSAPQMRTVVEVFGAMIYAMEWTSIGQPPVGAGIVPTQAMTGPFEPGYVLNIRTVEFPDYEPQLRRLFELMLVIDYGFPALPICGEFTRDFFS